MKIEDIKKTITIVHDYPIQGIVFKDITTLLEDPEAFKNNCNNMYKNKTFKRVFSHKEFDALDSVQYINGIMVKIVVI